MHMLCMIFFSKKMLEVKDAVYNSIENVIFDNVKCLCPLISICLCNYYDFNLIALIISKRNNQVQSKLDGDYTCILLLLTLLN